MNQKQIIERNKHPYDEIMSKTYDWHLMKSEYVEGYEDEEGNQVWPTMHKIAIKHGCPPTYLRRIASEQHWTTEKQNFITNYEHAKQAEKIKFLAKKSSNFDNRCIKIAEKGIKEIEKLLCDTIDARIDDGDSIKQLFTMEELEIAAKTLEKFQKIGRLALGSSTDNVSKTIKAAGEIIPFSTGIDIVAEQIESNPELKNKLIDEFIDD